MKFASTRGEAPALGFSATVETGLAPDGGLFLPASLPDLTPHLKDWRGLSYPELAFRFLRFFATDIPELELHGLIRESYDGFRGSDPAPLRRLAPGLQVLELFHGPTLAFKDFALQLLGRLYRRQVRLSGQKITVLGATSGDTGAAAIHGLADQAGIRVFILYPEGRISPLQERQMCCTGAANIFPLAVPGSFDDAQRALKQVFADRGFAARVGLSAVNSINLARILAQSVYYLHAWLALGVKPEEPVRFVVPTGNFGNVFAGWLLTRMGLPGLRFRVATNRNDILYRFFTDGEYHSGGVEPSLAPSMDIQAASNFERLLYYFEGGDPARVRAAMAALARGESYRMPAGAAGAFSASRADDDAIRQRIGEVYREFGYIIDPHTACGFQDLERDGVPTIVLATASPAKFPETIVEATGEEPKDPLLEALKKRMPVGYRCGADAAAIQEFILAQRG
ncbi:MAG: threonine synthase [Puniceicoccaceae bacterium]|nr:MAG: threonine synthase [Puniceicoccaceae bacterium]